MKIEAFLALMEMLREHKMSISVHNPEVKKNELLVLELLARHKDGATRDGIHRFLGLPLTSVCDIYKKLNERELVVGGEPRGEMVKISSIGIDSLPNLRNALAFNMSEPIAKCLTKQEYELFENLCEKITTSNNITE